MRKLIWLPLAGALLVGGAAVAAAAPTIFNQFQAGPIAAVTNVGNELLSNVLADLVDKGVISADQATQIKDAYASALDAKRSEIQAQRQAMADQLQQLRGFLSDGVLTQAELDQLPADSPFQGLSKLMTSGQVSVDQLRQLGFGLGFGRFGGPGPFGPGRGGWMHGDWPQPSPSSAASD